MISSETFKRIKAVVLDVDGVLTDGRGSEANRKRAAELGLSFIYENCKDKLEGFERLLAEHGLRPEECLYIGDDVIDLPVLLSLIHI